MSTDYAALKLRVKSGPKLTIEVPSIQIVTEAMGVNNIAQRVCEG